MQGKQLMCDVGQFVIPFKQWTSTFATQELVHVPHERISHKYLGKHIPGNLRQRGRVELHHRKTIASGQKSTNIGPYLQTNT